MRHGVSPHRPDARVSGRSRQDSQGAVMRRAGEEGVQRRQTPRGPAPAPCGAARDCWATVEAAIRSGSRVLGERPRQVNWKGKEGPLPWGKWHRRWDFLWTPACGSKVKAVTGKGDLPGGGGRDPAYLTKLK